MFKGLHLLTPIVTTGAIIAIPTSNQMIFNESTRKRSFYEDDENVVPIPGTVTPAPATELETLGSNRIIVAFPCVLHKAQKTCSNQLENSLNQSVDSLNSWADQKYHQYNKTERSVTDTVSSLHSKSEDLLPNSLYILVAVLSGTIAGRTRGVVAKITLPTVFGLTAFKYFCLKHLITLLVLLEIRKRKCPSNSRSTRICLQ